MTPSWGNGFQQRFQLARATEGCLFRMNEFLKQSLSARQIPLYERLREITRTGLTGNGKFTLRWSQQSSESDGVPKRQQASVHAEFISLESFLCNMNKMNAWGK
jgi:hypothetical protein